MDKIAAHSMDFWLQTEDLPLAQNRVTVDGHGQITLNTATNVRASAGCSTGWNRCSIRTTGSSLRRAEIYFGSAMGIEAVGHRPAPAALG